MTAATLTLEEALASGWPLSVIPGTCGICDAADCVDPAELLWPSMALCISCKNSIAGVNELRFVVPDGFMSSDDDRRALRDAEWETAIRDLYARGYPIRRIDITERVLAAVAGDAVDELIEQEAGE